MKSSWSVVCADVLDWLRSLPADYFDLIFTSPPYELARLYLEGGRNIGIARKTEAWVAWLVEVIRECVRVCKGLVAFVVEGQTKNFKWSAGPALLMADLHRAGLNLRKPPAFARVGIPGSGGPDFLRNDYEFIVCVSRPGKLPWSDNTAMGHPPKWAPGGEMSYRLTDGSRRNEWGGSDNPTGMQARYPNGKHKPRLRTKGGSPKDGIRKPIFRHKEDSSTPTDHDRLLNLKRANPGNIIKALVGGGVMGDRLCHENEAPFPEALAEFFVRSFCPPAGRVGDPFSGSGTTGAMAVRFGRLFEGCDVRQSQVDLSMKRIGKEANLFEGMV